MPEPTTAAPAASDAPIEQGTVTVRVEDLHVRYRVYEDVRRSLRSMFVTAGRGRRHREIHAVKGVSFSAYAGEAIGVIGSNGSGKSTLMRAVAGLLPVTQGTVYARFTPMLLGVGAVLHKGLSGRRNIMLGGLALGLTKEQVKAREKEIIEFSGIGHAIDLPMKTYSSGMSARLQFSISAAVEPEILIIDEALSVGDREFKQRSQERIRQLRSHAGTVFIVSHGLRSIQKNCTRVLWIEQGELRADGDPKEVTEMYHEYQMNQAPPSKADERKRQRKRKRRKRRQERRQERRQARRDARRQARRDARRQARRELAIQGGPPPGGADSVPPVAENTAPRPAARVD